MNAIYKLLIAGIALLPAAVSAQVTADWDFSTAFEGSALDEVNGAVGTGSNYFDANFGSSTVTADGVYRYNYSGSYMNSLASTSLGSESTTAWLLVEMAGWDADPDGVGQMLISLGGSTGSSAAGVRIQMSDDLFTLEAMNYVSGEGLMYEEVVQLPTLSSTGLSFAMDFDLVSETYDFYYKVGNAGWELFAEDLAAWPGRGAETVRIRAGSSGFGGDNYLDFARIAMSETSLIPEVNAFPLLGGLAAIGAVLVVRRRKQRPAC